MTDLYFVACNQILVTWGVKCFSHSSIYLLTIDHGGGGLRPHQGAGGGAPAGVWHVWQVTLLRDFNKDAIMRLRWRYSRPHILNHRLVCVIEVVSSPEANSAKSHVDSNLVFNAEADGVIVPHLIACVCPLINIVKIWGFRHFIPNSSVLWRFYKGILLCINYYYWHPHRASSEHLCRQTLSLLRPCSCSLWRGLHQYSKPRQSRLNLEASIVTSMIYFKSSTLTRIPVAIPRSAQHQLPWLHSELEIFPQPGECLHQRRVGSGLAPRVLPHLTLLIVTHHEHYQIIIKWKKR